MRVCSQLTQGQRYRIEALVKIGHNQTMVVEVLTVNKSTISRKVMVWEKLGIFN
jgi:IS30 family transposase